MNSTFETFGGIDVLVNNAGIQHVAPVDEFPVDMWNAILAVAGITANAVGPGYVLTPLVEKQIPDTAKARGLTEEQVKRSSVPISPRWSATAAAP